MMTTLSDDIKQLVRMSMLSHANCAHDDASLCYLLISAEVEFRQGGLLDDDEFEAVGDFIADEVLESLILKGMVEPTAVNEAGEFIFGVTEAGKEAHSRYTGEKA